MIVINSRNDDDDEDEATMDDRARMMIRHGHTPCSTRGRISWMSLALMTMLLANMVAWMALRRQQQQQQKEWHISMHRHLQQQEQQDDEDDVDSFSLWKIKILVAIASYDFSQLPHLEQVLEGYHDMCIAGATVKVVIHTTVPWPVSLVDLLETRFVCHDFTVDLVLKLPRIKLHLVDCHRQLFYEHLTDYDVFVYSEDDQRVTPRTVATYLQQTHYIQQHLLLQHDQQHSQYKPSDFNVGVVRYEYNFPAKMVMEDRTRQVTQNVTRVYWEHSSFPPPLIPNAVEPVPQPPFHDTHLHMKNHHQGMFLATPALLRDWQQRPCHFHIASKRPGRKNQPSQPLYGTQRVWMSSQQLLGRARKNKTKTYHGGAVACGVQQVLPIDLLGALTVHHLPNKNYRRVGQYRTRDTTRNEQVIVEPEESYWTALRLHFELVRHFTTSKSKNKNLLGKMKKQVRFTMTASPEIPTDQYPTEWRPKLDAFQNYVQRGGIMNEQDMIL
jgi:hypothetical protein